MLSLALVISPLSSFCCPFSLIVPFYSKKHAMWLYLGRYKRRELCSSQTQRLPMDQGRDSVQIEYRGWMSLLGSHKSVICSRVLPPAEVIHENPCFSGQLPGGGGAQLNQGWEGRGLQSFQNLVSPEPPCFLQEGMLTCRISWSPERDHKYPGGRWLWSWPA